MASPVSGTWTVEDQHELLHVEGMVRCPYYQHEAQGKPFGTCNLGCHVEPECMTCAPAGAPDGGWPAELRRLRAERRA